MFVDAASSDFGYRWCLDEANRLLCASLPIIPGELNSMRLVSPLSVQDENQGHKVIKLNDEKSHMCKSGKFMCEFDTITL